MSKVIRSSLHHNVVILFDGVSSGTTPPHERYEPGQRGRSPVLPRLAMRVHGPRMTTRPS